LVINDILYICLPTDKKAKIAYRNLYNALFSEIHDERPYAVIGNTVDSELLKFNCVIKIIKHLKFLIFDTKEDYMLFLLTWE
jgi:hypothetical protein